MNTYVSPLLVLFLSLIPSILPAAENDVLLADFEGANYGDWRIEGDAFGQGPPRGTLPGQHPVTGYLGQGLVNSFLNGDSTTGSMTSPEFKISHGFISFLVGGGRHAGSTAVQLLVDDEVVREATGEDAELLLWHNFDVRALKGNAARIRIIDNETGGWGHINVDQILLTDVKRSKVDPNKLDEYRNSPEYYREPYRPQFHFTPEINWMNDPNGLVHFDGEWHLFYQYNPFGNAWGHMSWGHAVSSDLVHWKHLPVALYDEGGTMIFSGCSVVDWNNTSGFGAGDDPPLVAIYTGHRSDNQSQCLAYSNDRGRTWTKYQGNPVLDKNERDFRDPKVFWHDGTNRWIMVVSMAAARYVQFYCSDNLRDWEHLSDFGPAGTPDKPNWECPDLFELPIEGQPGKTKWVLEVDMGGGSIAGGSGGEYFIGDFDGTEFHCDHPLEKNNWVDYGRDFYAPVSWSDVPEEDGRRIWIGWINNWETHLLPTHPWRSAQSIPRVLKLRGTPDGLRMVQQPVEELKTLRAEEFERSDQEIAPGEVWSDPSLEGQLLEIQVTLEIGDATEVGLRVLKSDREATTIGYYATEQRVFVDRENSGDSSFHKAFAGKHAGPLPHENGLINLHVFVDTSSVEVFGNDGYTVITDRVFPCENSSGVEFYAVGGMAKIKELKAWKLESVWQGN